MNKSTADERAWIETVRIDVCVCFVDVWCRCRVEIVRVEGERGDATDGP